MNETNKQKEIGLVRELMQKLGITPQEMIASLNAEMLMLRPKQKLIKGETVCVGMFWYCDNTFSYGLLPKPIKAVVEYIDEEYIYGDLTALLSISEVKCSYNKNGVRQALCLDEFIEGIPYTCDDNEKIVCYSHSQMKRVFDSYALVKRSLEKIKKLPRKEDEREFYWTTDKDHYVQRVFSFKGEGLRAIWVSMYGEALYRPVLRMKYN